MPTGLDGQSATSRDGLEALRLSRLVGGWIKQANCGRVYIGGDMNQTVTGGRGSIRGGALDIHPPRHSPGALEKLLSEGLIDLYDKCHPGHHLAESFTREGLTCTPGVMSVSRIDYILVNRGWWAGARTHACEVVDNSTGSDHRVLTMRLPLNADTKSDGTWSRDADKMRPIMVGNEIYKLRQRILSYRLGEILLIHPGILDEAQRGFLRQGCTAQCIDVL
jgi:hypothetical protein